MNIDEGTEKKIGEWLEKDIKTVFVEEGGNRDFDEVQRFNVGMSYQMHKSSKNIERLTTAMFVYTAVLVILTAFIFFQTL